MAEVKELVEETAMEQAERLQKEVDEYKEYLDGITDQDTLREEEKKCIEALEEYDKYVTDVTYDIPNDVDFEGTRYTRKAVAAKIVYFIEKNEVTWQYTLGLYQLCKIWKGDVKTITYKQLDSTLRILEQPKFKGMQEWHDILMINEYMKALHEAYTKDLATQIALSQKHNAVMDRMDLTGKVTTDAGHEEV